MPDFKKIVEQFADSFQKLDTTRKIVILSIALTFVGAIIAVSVVSSSQTQNVLFKNMDVEEFAKVTAKLDDLGVKFSTSGTHTVFVAGDKRDEVVMALAQENMIPKGVYGWELFDEEKWSETQFEKDIKKQRALMGSLSNMLSKLKSVETAEVSIAFPEEELFEDSIQPVTAAVLLNYSPGVEQLKRKEVEGIVTLVSRAVPNLKKENVSVAGPDGEILNDYDNDIDKEKWELKAVTEKLKIQETERVKLLSDIRKSLNFAYGGERSDIVRLDVQMRWDKEEIERNEVEPVVMMPDNPDTPYSELEVKDSLEVSSKTTEESFVGNGFTPEGPAGTEPNIPPGYKDRDYQKANYTKRETIKNNQFNQTKRIIQKQPWEISRVTIAVILDGRWEKQGINEEGTGYIRQYHPVDEEELARVADLLKKAIGYNVARGDQVTVKHIQKDRSDQFMIEDDELRRKRTFRRMLMATLVSLLGIVIVTIAYQLIRKEMERRRRMREEELAAQQQMMREAALRAIEDENVEVEMSLEDKARKEMIENAINLAKDRPEEVAQLLRTWLAED